MSTPTKTPRLRRATRRQYRAIRAIQEELVDLVTTDLGEELELMEAKREYRRPLAGVATIARDLAVYAERLAKIAADRA